MPDESLKSGKPKRPKALGDLLEAGERIADQGRIGESEPVDESAWQAAVRDHRLSETGRELAALKDLASTHQRFLAVLKSRPDLFFAGDPQDLIRDILSAAKDLVRAERAAFFRLDSQGRLRVRQTLPDGEHFDKMSRSLVRDALLDGLTHYHHGGEDMQGSERASVLHLGLEAVVAVPLKGDRKLMGVLYLDSRRGGSFNPADVPTLELLTQVAAAAMLRLDQLSAARKTGRKLELENRELKSVLQDRARFGRLSAESPSMRNVIDQLKRMAPLRTSVRLEGETGTGKEVIARALHEEGPWSVRIPERRVHRSRPEPAGSYRTGERRHALPR